MVQWGLLVLVACFSGALAVPITDDTMKFMNTTWDKCQKQENVPDDAMKDLYFFKSVEGVKDHKCVIKCINEEYGIYQKDGTLSKEMIEQAIKGHWKNQETQQKLISGNDECMDSVNQDPDPCQYNHDIFECFIQVLKKKGITAHPKNED